ncbi:50S ribosomal protein L23 [filamentous cyanobacterium LEGE 11480]|uniref:Large ribosomal subunit protein uL23 n=1 Tax=Romeriopsis navalis LEGE 11480 TaxID=2777977 RepID=A0A928Z6V1_9CYAN|nr:50S ribosomal protein L23 [Romeriopsis navalis]MBE9032585.1 50S ribosomal protein L23 [Romeriopsis navalis LEGE 11480]
MTKTIDQRQLADIVYRPIITEKATMSLENNHYTFEVDPRADKTEIRAAIEYLFNVKVIGISTHKPPRKKKRVGKYMGYKPGVKRAVVKLAEGDSIPLFPES